MKKNQCRQPAVNRIYFYLSGGCNLKCRHCWIAPKYREEGHTSECLDVGLFSHIIDQAKKFGLKGVKLTGGEPLLHPQITDILDIVRRRELGLSIETNGLLVTPSLVDEIKRCRVRSVSVSLDGVDPDTHETIRGVPGCFQKAISGIKNLVQAGIPPQVIMTLTQWNKDQISDMVDLAVRLGARSVKFNLLQPTARGRDLYDNGAVIGIAELIRLGQWVNTELSAATPIRIDYSQPFAFRPISRFYGRNRLAGRCGIRGILGVLSNGSYALCGIGESIPELVFGHGSKDAFDDVWTDHPVLNAIRDGLPGNLEGICGQCLMKQVCQGSCIAQNYYRRQNLWAPFWYCEEADKHGLFPKARRNMYKS